MAISSEIIVIRQKAFLTQEAFAKELEVAFSTVNRWESGKAHPIPFEALENAWLGRSEA